MTKQTEISVLTEEKIKQKLAGYKSHYTRKVNAAKTAKERKALESKRDEYIAERLAELNEQNKKQIQRRAGVLSWETRRANSQKRTVQPIECQCKKQAKAFEKKTTDRRRGSKVGVRVISK